ncbi:MAG TPA: protein translocase subunit SecD [Steroidobacteraceae bacterium]|nr:protein translocase subunit SecD [Steroidobacteraceae bacterium]
MLEYARWKYILIAAVLLVALIFALPNVFGSAPALQLAHKDHSPITAAEASTVDTYLTQHGVKFVKSYIESGRLMVQFADVPDQLQGRDAVEAMPQSTYISALSFVPRAPAIFRDVGLTPMPLGLDLRGGLELLYQVDVNSAVTQLLQGYSQDASRALAAAKIPLRSITFAATSGSAIQNALRITLAPGADLGAAQQVLSSPLQGLTVNTQSSPEGPQLIATMTPAQIKQREDYAIEQNITTLRNRVNQLGVSEPSVTRQGLDRIDVQLPGIQNPAEVKNLLGQFATLEFRLNDTQANPLAAAQSGDVPLGDKLYTNTVTGMPLLLKREVIATGDQLTNATVGQSQNGGPSVNVTLDSKAGDNMLRTTRQNVGKPMAVVLIEKHQETHTVDGKEVTRQVTTERVINDATIQGVFSDRFEITGLTVGEAHDLAILLRSGSLTAPIALVSQNVIGPSLGAENIRMGIAALIIGMAGVLLFMAIYYKIFGLVADAVLVANVVLLAALLSMMHATLSLPGIAGIILTVGIAVDANVLIYERIREELRKGVTPQAAIRAGFEKAFSAIADSNVTTIIAGLVLWVFGTGAIRGFAVVLTLGIITSMFTSLMGSRALVTLMYGRKRKVARLWI